MKRAERLAVQCEKMKKRLTSVGIISRDLFERGLCSMDEFLDMKLEERTLRAELQSLAEELKLCK